MPFYIIKTSKGYYNGFDKTGMFPTYSPEITHDVYVCGENEEEATDDFDFHRGLITAADGLETMPKLMAVKSKPAPPEPSTVRITHTVEAPPPGWDIKDEFGAKLAFMTDGKRFAVRTGSGIEMFQTAKEAAVYWCLLRDQVFKARVDKRWGGDGGA